MVDNMDERNDVFLREQEGIREYLKTFENTSDVQNTIERTLASIQSLETAILGEKQKTRKLLEENLYLKRRLELKRRGHISSHLRQGLQQVTKQFTHISNYYNQLFSTSVSKVSCSIFNADTTTHNVNEPCTVKRTVSGNDGEKKSEEKDSGISQNNEASTFPAIEASSCMGTTCESDADSTKSQFRGRMVHLSQPKLDNTTSTSTYQESDGVMSNPGDTMQSNVERRESMLIMDVALNLSRNPDKDHLEHIRILAFETVQDKVDGWKKCHLLTKSQKQKLIERLEKEEENALCFPVHISLTVSDLE